MPSFILTDAAEQDLLEVWRYTYQTWGMEQADRYLDKLEAACESIGTNMAFGKAWQDIHPHLKSIRCEHHYLFILDDQTNKPVIIAVLHERMDFLTRLKNRLD